MLKYIVKAAAEELTTYAVLAAIISLIVGVGYGVHWIFGKYAGAVILLLLLAAFQGCIILQRALALKKQAPKE